MTISIEEFAKAELVVGIVKEANDIPDAKKLLLLKVDVGEPEPRTIVSGLKESFSPADLVGKNVVILAILPPRSFKIPSLEGITSAGMILAVKDKDGLALLTTTRPTTPGTKVS